MSGGVSLLNTTKASALTHDYVFYMYGSYVLLIFLFGLIQNTVTFYVFMSDMRLRLLHNYFIVALAFADVGMCVCGNWMIVLSAFFRRWIFGHLGCVYYGFSTTLFGITQICLLSAIAFDRFVIIARPRGFSFSKKTAKIAVLLCYITGFGWALLPVIGWSSYQLEGIGIRCAINWKSHTRGDLAFSMSILVCGWVFPLALILYSYGGIFCKLRQERIRSNTINTNLRIRRDRRDRRMAVTVLLMIIAFIISWTPYSIITLAASFGEKDITEHWVAVFPPLIAKTSIIWNPVIYVARHGNFRRAFFEKCPCLRDFIQEFKTFSIADRLLTDSGSITDRKKVSSISTYEWNNSVSLSDCLLNETLRETSL